MTARSWHDDNGAPGSSPGARLPAKFRAFAIYIEMSAAFAARAFLTVAIQVMIAFAVSTARALIRSRTQAATHAMLLRCPETDPEVAITVLATVIAIAAENILHARPSIGAATPSAAA